jgi:hypothetical protein
VSPWCYELTTEVHNVGVMVAAASKTLKVNPAWLRFVVQSGDFTACVADEIVAWYLIRRTDQRRLSRPSKGRTPHSPRCQAPGLASAAASAGPHDPLA